MPRESTIQVYRSTTTDIPTGLTFGEIAYSTVNNRVFIGDATGNSIWVGAGVTTGTIATNSSVLIPTQSAVKTYVDGIVGGGSVVNSINGTGGNITITGDSGSQQVSVSGTTTTITNRLATTSLTGVASFNSADFSVASGAVSLQSNVAKTTSSVASINGATGAITITGDSGSQRVSVSGATTTITNRLATTTATGVAYFNPAVFTVGADGGVNLINSQTVFSARGSRGGSNIVNFGTVFTITGGGGIDAISAFDGTNTTLTVTNTGVLSANGATGAITITGDSGSQQVSVSGTTTTITNRLATASLTGVASFNATRFTVSAAGAVDLATAYLGTGDTVAAVGSVSVSRSGNVATIDNRIATTSLTGVASFSSTNFDVASGAVSIKSGGVPNAALANSSFTLRDEVGGTDTISLGDTLTITGGRGVDFIRTTTDTYEVRGITATSSVLGVASFNTASFTVTNGDVTIKNAGVSNTQLVNSSVTVSAGTGLGGGGSVALGSSTTLTNLGVLSLNGLTGALTMTGDGGAVRGVGNNAITARAASTSLTGVASFNSASFDVSAGGDVTIKTGGVSNTQLANSSISVFANASNTISLGSTLTITGTANQVAVSSGSGTVTLGLPNDITIPGNLTVNGTVVTANVNNFVVEDPLFMLGTGNAADSVDLGFYGQYASTGTRYAGLFRDASDGGKFKLFAGLTAEPTTFVDNSFSSFAVATLIAKIDGGTF